jgi:single-strand DNA-binding protein
MGEVKLSGQIRRTYRKGKQMSASVNRVIIVGNLCRDVEVRTFQSGGKVANLRVATNETWKEKSTGDRKERAEYHSVAIFNEGLVRVAEQYLRKGSKVYIEGQLQTRKWQDQSGQDRYSTEIVLQSFKGTLVMLDGRNGESAGSGTQDQYRGHPGGYDQSPSGYGAGGRASDMGEEIPFNCVRLI